jgi:hypothetical protein
VALFLVAVSTQQDLSTGRLAFAFVAVFVLSLSLSSNVGGGVLVAATGVSARAVGGAEDVVDIVSAEDFRRLVGGKDHDLVDVAAELRSIWVLLLI